MVYISEKDCIAVMEAAMKGKSFDLTDFVLQPFSDIMGFHGSHALLKITAKVGGKVKNFEFFVKLATKNQKAFDRYFSRAKLFLKEHVMITRLMKNLEAQVAKKLTSECYLSRLNKFMVLENLNDLNYETIRRKEGMDLAHSKIAVQTFADFHAASILLQHNGTDMAEKYPELMEETFIYYPADDDEPELTLVRSTHIGVSAWAEVHAKHIPTNIRTTALEKAFSRIILLVKSSKEYKNVTCQGDPWGNNIMYRYDNDTPFEGILVDFQASRFAPPALEIVQFLYVALDPDLREKHESELLDAYYSRLGQTLSSRGLDVDVALPRSEFDTTTKVYREYGICTRLYYSYVTRVPAKYLAPAAADVDKFLDFMIGGDPSMPMAAAEDKAYLTEVKSAIDDVVHFYTGHKRAEPPKLVI